MARPEPRVSPAEKAQARDVSLRRIGALFRDHRMPLAVVVLREGAAATDGELRDFLAPSFAKFWLPDRFEYVDEIPKTAVGKFRKTALREQFASATPVENA